MSRTTRGGPLLVAGVVVVLIIVVAVVALRRSPEKADLVILGDSVSYDSGGRITSRLHGGHEIQIIAVPGHTTQQMLDKLDAAIAEDKGPAAAKDEIAVLIGYNDLREGSVETDALAKLAKRTSEYRCAVWLTLPGTPKDLAPNPEIAPEDVTRWNQRLATELAPYDNVHLNDAWRDAVDASTGQELLTDDGLHPNAHGQDALAKAYQSALDRAC